MKGRVNRWMDVKAFLRIAIKNYDEPRQFAFDFVCELLHVVKVDFLIFSLVLVEVNEVGPQVGLTDLLTSLTLQNRLVSKNKGLLRTMHLLNEF